MLVRLGTASVLAPMVLLVALYGPLWLIGAFISAAGLITLDECIRIALPKGPWAGWDRRYALLSATLAYTMTILLGIEGLALGFAFAVLLTMASVLFRPHDLDTAGPRLVALLGSMAYLVGLFGVILLYPVLGQPEHRYILLLMFLTVFLGDTAAYFMGRAIGGPKLFALISPKKTWAGAFGGVLGSIFGAWVAKATMLPDLSWVSVVGLGVGVAVVEQIGDLAESLIKRSWGVKDSSSLLPGHGGLLDRIDGVIFAGVWVFTWFRYFG